MSDKSHFFKERLQTSSDIAERVRARWGIVYHAVETIHSSETVEHGADLLQPETAPPQPINEAPITRHEAVQAAHVGSNVVSLEAYREHRQQTAVEVEAMGKQRMAEQARLNAEAARQEREGYNGQFAA